MSQERNRKNGRGSHLDVALVSNYFVFTFTTSRKVDDAGQRNGDKAAEPPQQGPHLILHGRGSRLALIFSYSLQQLVKASVGVAKVQVAKDASQRG